MTSIAACEYACQIIWFDGNFNFSQNLSALKSRVAPRKNGAVPGPQASDRRSVHFSAMGGVEFAVCGLYVVRMKVAEIALCARQGSAPTLVQLALAIAPMPLACCLEIAPNTG
eukprot:COSAG01_NODE_11156_length_1993_cov_14.355163_2_plen_113_part_00